MDAEVGGMSTHACSGVAVAHLFAQAALCDGRQASSQQDSEALALASRRSLLSLSSPTKVSQPGCTQAS